jgi:hypothetical protein
MSRYEYIEIPVRVFVYPHDDKPGYFIAHGLDMDVMGTGKSVQEALSELLEVIEVQIDSCEKTGAPLHFPASREVWDKYRNHRRRKLPKELVERVINEANRRLGYSSLESISASDEISDAQLLAMA